MVYLPSLAAFAAGGAGAEDAFSYNVTDGAGGWAVGQVRIRYARLLVLCSLYALSVWFRALRLVATLKCMDRMLHNLTAQVFGHSAELIPPFFSFARLRRWALDSPTALSYRINEDVGAFPWLASFLLLAAAFAPRFAWSSSFADPRFARLPPLLAECRANQSFPVGVSLVRVDCAECPVLQ